jgi:hypothetical protein
MNKHLIPDRSTLPRLPYRLLTEGWWLEENAITRDNIIASDTQSTLIPPPQPRCHEVLPCN